MEQGFIIRPVKLTDAEDIREIYRPYVEEQITSFEYELPPHDEWLERIRSISAEYPYIVCEHNGKVVGYSYGCRHRYRTAYSWSAESAIYVHEKYHGAGIARLLYETLFRLLRLQGYANVYAGVGLPNDKSVKFHRSMGFYDVGTFRRVGFKFGKWWDTQWFQLHLIDEEMPPGTLVSTDDLQNNSEYWRMIEDANKKIASRSTM